MQALEWNFLKKSSTPPQKGDDEFKGTAAVIYRKIDPQEEWNKEKAPASSFFPK